MSGVLRIATRSSRLARCQAEMIAARLGEATGRRCELHLVSTQGDRNTRDALDRIGGTGVFTREVEEALRRGEADLAVHSLKDVPVAGCDLSMMVFPEREDPRDAFIPAKKVSGLSLRDLPQGATVATASPRRQACARELRPDLGFCMIRGNVETRLRKIDEGLADGTLLAVAGLKRLGLTPEIHPLPIELFPPAAGQGILAIQTLDKELLPELKRLEDPVTRQCVEAERLVLAALGGGCQNAVGVIAIPGWTIHAARESGGRLVRFARTGSDLAELVKATIDAMV